MSKTKKRVFARAGRGSVLLVALLLVGSAAIRVFTSATEVLAAAPEGLTLPLQRAPTVAEDSQVDRRAEISSLLEAIRAREEAVEKREKQVEVRIKAMTVAQQEIDRRLAALVQAEEDLRATVALADTAAEGDLARLTSVYENMKPKEAAALFEQMDPEFAAGFMSRMRPDVAASVMAGLTPQAAYTISVILAGRNANAPTE